eukprot:2415983-Prymnesium_polylepis.1
MDKLGVYGRSDLAQIVDGCSGGRNQSTAQGSRVAQSSTFAQCRQLLDLTTVQLHVHHHLSAVDHEHLCGLIALEHNNLALQQRTARESKPLPQRMHLPTPSRSSLPPLPRVPE